MADRADAASTIAFGTFCQALLPQQTVGAISLGGDIHSALL